MTWGRRKADRVQFNHQRPANLMAEDGTWRRASSLIDILETGAKVELEGSTDVLTLRELFLVLSSTGLAFSTYQLVWIDGPVFGVHFVSDKKISKAAS